MRFAPVQLTVDSLACRRGERVLFEGLGFSVSPGVMLEVAGPNGVGKSSLLRILAGLLKPEAGRVAFARDGKALSGDDPPAAALLHYLGHLDGLKAQMSVRETLRFAVSFFGVGGGIDAALERVGLTRQAELPVAYLSAGQRKRLALARCLLLDRPVWLLDEPTAALDSAGKGLVANLVAAHCAAGGLVVAATHEAILPSAQRLVMA